MAATQNGSPIEGLVVEIKKRVMKKLDSRRGGTDDAVEECPFPLNAEQERCLAGIGLSIQALHYEAILLEGVTGSGKTEIYLRAIQQTLSLGRAALVLVPEIALTPQLLARMQQRLGRVAVFHSGLTPSERRHEWLRVHSGECLVAVGARSAVFLPFTNLGLIVVDEEQIGRAHV